MCTACDLLSLPPFWAVVGRTSASKNNSGHTIGPSPYAFLHYYSSTDCENVSTGSKEMKCLKVFLKLRETTWSGQATVVLAFNVIAVLQVCTWTTPTEEFYLKHSPQSTFRPTVQRTWSYDEQDCISVQRLVSTMSLNSASTPLRIHCSNCAWSQNTALYFW